MVCVGVTRGLVVHFVNQIPNVALGGPTFQRNSGESTCVSVFHTIGAYFRHFLERLQKLGITTDFLTSTSVASPRDLGSLAREGIFYGSFFVTHEQLVRFEGGVGRPIRRLEI